MKNKPNDGQGAALWSVGFLKPYDVIMGAALCASWALFVILVSRLSANSMIVWALANVGLAQIWAIALTFRCSWFVIKVWADIKMMPAEAAKLAVGFVQQGPEGE